MTKKPRKQAVKTQKQAKIKADRKHKDKLVFLNQEIKPFIDEADRHMKEADRPLKEATRDRETEKTFVSHSARGLEATDHRDDEVRSLFTNNSGTTLRERSCMIPINTLQSSKPTTG